MKKKKQKLFGGKPMRKVEKSEPVAPVVEANKPKKKKRKDDD